MNSGLASNENISQPTINLILK